jgi:hypothetical protein
MISALQAHPKISLPGGFNLPNINDDRGKMEHVQYNQMISGMMKKCKNYHALGNSIRNFLSPPKFY